MRLVYNANFPRWEVYGNHPVIRGGKQQPVFVSKDRSACEEYIKRVEART